MCTSRITAGPQWVTATLPRSAKTMSARHVENGGTGARRGASGHAKEACGTRHLSPGSAASRISRPASGSRADRAGEMLPRRAPGKGRRQVQDEATYGAIDPHRELAQPLTRRDDLRVGAGSAARPTRSSWNRMYAPRVSRTRNWLGRNREPLGPVDLQPVMQFLELVFHIAPLAVDLLVNGLGRAGEIGDDEPGIVLEDRVRDVGRPVPAPASCRKTRACWLR